MEALISMSDKEISYISCCLTQKRLTVGDRTQFRKHIRELLPGPKRGRKLFMGNFPRTEKGGCYKYDGNIVRTTFLLKGFMFSRNLEISVKKLKVR